SYSLAFCAASSFSNAWLISFCAAARLGWRTALTFFAGSLAIASPSGAARAIESERALNMERMADLSSVMRFGSTAGTAAAGMPGRRDHLQGLGPVLTGAHHPAGVV